MNRFYVLRRLLVNASRSLHLPVFNDDVASFHRGRGVEEPRGFYTGFKTATIEIEDGRRRREERRGIVPRRRTESNQKRRGGDGGHSCTLEMVFLRGVGT